MTFDEKTFPLMSRAFKKFQKDILKMLRFDQCFENTLKINDRTNYFAEIFGKGYFIIKFHCIFYNIYQNTNFSGCLLKLYEGL